MKLAIGFGRKCDRAGLFSARRFGFDAGGRDETMAAEGALNRRDWKFFRSDRKNRVAPEVCRERVWNRAAFCWSS